MLLDCDPSGCPPDTAEARSQMYVYIYIYVLCMVCIFMLQLELRIYDGAEIGRNWKKRL